MKYVAILLSVIMFSCKKENIPPHPPCNNISIEVVNTDVSSWVQASINGVAVGQPIMHWQAATLNNLSSGATYNVSAVNLRTKDTAIYSVTLNTTECGSIVTQDVNP